MTSNTQSSSTVLKNKISMVKLLLYSWEWFDKELHSPTFDRLRIKWISHESWEDEREIEVSSVRNIGYFLSDPVQYSTVLCSTVLYSSVRNIGYYLSDPSKN